MQPNAPQFNETNALSMPPRSTLRISLMFTSLLVMTLILAYALMVASDSHAAYSPNTSDSLLLAAQPTSTLDIMIATAINDPDQLATVQALIQEQINASVRGTLIALTPTATPLPTRAPIDETFNTTNPSFGPADAPITLVEFSDYLCGFCGRFHAQTLAALQEHYGDLLRFVYREYPVIGQNLTAMIGASAQCANLQGKYWEYTDLVWANQLGAERQEFTPELLVDYAIQAKLDMNAYNTCLQSEEGFNLVVADFQAGQAYVITGTPTFFINGERLVGAQPIEVFMDVIDRHLREQGIEPPARS